MKVLAGLPRTAMVGVWIVGAFIAPFVVGIGVNWYNQPRLNLKYTVSPSGLLTGTGETKQIYVIEIRNTGEKELQDLFAEVKLNFGRLEDLSTETSPGLMPTKSARDSTIHSISANFFNPAEYVKFFLLIHGPSQAPVDEPTIAVRARGVNAERLPLGATFDDGQITYLLMIVLGLMASAGAAILLYRRSSGDSLEPNEIGAYICARAGLNEEAEKLRFSPTQFTYRGIADYLLLRGSTKKEPESGRYTAAIKALLLNSDMAASSIQSIRRSIKSIQGADFKEASIDEFEIKALHEGNDPGGTRDQIDKFFAHT